MTVKTVFKRSFSEIRGIQKKETILYKISNSSTNGSDNMYGIQVSSISDKNVISNAVYHISPSKDDTMSVIRFLYENSVKAEVSNDIISDLNNFFTYRV